MQPLDRRQFHLLGAALASTGAWRASATPATLATPAAATREGASEQAAPAARKRVAFVVGDHEYSSERTLPLFAAEYGRAFGHDTIVLRSFPDHHAEEDIPGLEWLEQCDAAVFYLRWRRLPPAQLARIESFLASGKGVIGLRTTTHAFNYPSGHASERWNAFGQFAFGAPPGWGAGGHTHYGHSSRTKVELFEGATDHELLRGVAPFEARSWLYHVVPDHPSPGATRLLAGTSIAPEHQPAAVNPVAWIWTNQWKGRAFFTTLGHPEDFRHAAMQRLLANGISWSMGLAVPEAWNGPWAIDVPYRGATR